MSDSRPKDPNTVIRIGRSRPASGGRPRREPEPGSERWVEKSNEYAGAIFAVALRFAPEELGPLGFPEVDEEIVRLPPDRDLRRIAAFEEVVGVLEQHQAQESEPQLLLDLGLMIEERRREIGRIRLESGLMLPYFNVAQLVFRGIRALLDDRIEAARRPAALVRLMRYAGLERGCPPLAEQAEAAIRSRLDEPGLLAPYRDAVVKDLAQGERLTAGVGKLFESYRISGYQRAHAALCRQLSAYHAFLREVVLPRARADFRLPAELYAARLVGEGVDMPVGELISRAKVAFLEIRKQLQALAPLVARHHGWALTDYRDVIRRLKKAQLTGGEILRQYRERIRDLERLIERRGILTLPAVELGIVLAGEAESAALPFPYMRFPRLIGRPDERIELVLPLKMHAAVGEDPAFDDFTFNAASLPITAHEVLGHAVHFTAIRESGVSLTRSFLAGNAAASEGWAVYVESEVRPYLPLESQLIVLQHCLGRAAKAFVDPGLHMGVVTPDQALRILRDEVVCSEALACQALERSTSRWPGQVTSYFCGHTRLSELRIEVEQLLGPYFDVREYHDFVLAQGLLPLSLLRMRVLAEFASRTRQPLAA
ncbi:MAG: DUF885 domain-containing protein [bacterium]|nr:DUF885 domain-containing protein [bacterium]